MDFGEAVKTLKAGGRVARAGWNGKGMHLELIEGAVQVGRAPAFEPFVAMYTAQRNWIPWLCLQTDMLATDWEKVT